MKNSSKFIGDNVERNDFINTNSIKCFAESLFSISPAFLLHPSIYEHHLFQYKTSNFLCKGRKLIGTSMTAKLLSLQPDIFGVVKFKGIILSVEAAKCTYATCFQRY